MNEDYYTETDFFTYADEEGGYYSLYRKGLDPETIEPGPVRDAWAAYVEGAKALEPLRQRLYELDDDLV